MDQICGSRVDRVVLKTGDLVRHVPTAKTASGLSDILLKDWGWLPDFEYGVVLDVQENLHLVYHFSSLGPEVCWYPSNQLNITLR